MEPVFRSFCSFGADKGTAPPLMEGAKLVKLCRDLKLLDKNLTSTDVDIVYSKVKSKTERRINFKQFEDALKLIAEKKFPGTEDALDKLKVKILEGGGPVAHGTTKAAKTGAVDRLTEAPTKTPSSSGAASEHKATNADTKSKAKVAVGGTGKVHSSNATGKSTHSTNGRSDGKTGGGGGGGGKAKNSGSAQKPIRAPNPDGKESSAPSETMEKEEANGKESGLGKPDAQMSSDLPDKGLQKNEEPTAVSGNKETQIRKEDS